jgi:hypothetical protein
VGSETAKKFKNNQKKHGLMMKLVGSSNSYIQG